MKIVIAEVEDWERKSFLSLEDSHEVIYEKGKITAAHADADIISVFIYSALDPALLSLFPRLQLIATRSTGYDHINMEYCRQNNITVCNVPTYGENTVAEHVFALLLAISHRLFDSVERTRKGDFSTLGLQGFDLRGKTLGVIGTGNIGRHVIRIAKGFEMEVVAYDVAPQEALASSLDFTYTSLERLYKQSDIITLHIPGGAANNRLLSTDAFNTIKEGAVLINTARGELIDAKALVRALSDKKISAAGLDVLPGEPLIREETELLRKDFITQHDLETMLADHVLLRMPNVFITPHNAFNTKEAIRRILNTTLENIQAFLKGSILNGIN